MRKANFETPESRLSAFMSCRHALNAQPVYPSVAKMVKVQGVVIIEAIIGVEGNVENARVIRSIPLLDEAALDAVRSWAYTPTLLNGRPTPAIMTVTVQFKLQ